MSFDVMHRIHTRWLTLSAHVYEHNIRALYTIFTCELKLECSSYLATAWRLMLEVVTDEGVSSVKIFGFMADNASGGWNVVCDIFWGGMPNLERDWMHFIFFIQSLRRHTVKGILESK